MRMGKKIIKKMLVLGIASICCITIGSQSVLAASGVTLESRMKKLDEDSIFWESWEDAPKIKVVLEDAYKIKGEKERFEIELENAEWYEKRNTTLAIQDSNGIALYDARIYVSTDAKAEVEVDIPREIEEGEEISFTIPLLIKIKANVEGVSVKINKLGDETKLLRETEVLIAGTTNKKMTWEVQDIPTIGEGEAIAPIYFKETTAGILGSREIEVTLNLKNRYLSFDEPAYDSKQENRDDTEYYLDIDEYLEYSGGFKEEGQKLRVTISKDGKTMRLRMSGSVPTAQGVIMLKNLPIKSTDRDVSSEEVIITLFGEDITAINQEVVVAYFESYKNKQEEVKEEMQEVNEDVKEKTEVEESTLKESVELEKVHINTRVEFHVNADYYVKDNLTHKMDGKTYVKAPGYTMVPVRYVAEALGVENMTFEQGHIQFSFNERVIELRSGSNEARVNGQVFQMQVPLQLVNGRVYAPIGEVANLLGVNKSWNSSTQSACFIN